MDKSTSEIQIHASTDLRQYENTLSIACKARFTSELICTCTCRAQHPLVQPIDIRSHSDPSFPYVLKK